MGKWAFGAAAVVASCSMGIVFASPALAQSSNFQPGGVVGSSALTGFSSDPLKPFHASSEAMFSSPISSQTSINALLSSLGVIGSSEVSPMGNTFIEAPYPTVEGISAPAIMSKQQEEKAERWTIASPALKRNVEVLVRPARGASTSAPVLYLLDGVDAKPAGDWLILGDVSQFGDDVTLVMPTQARASLWMDWLNDDPVLGHNMWETFLTKELPGLIESQPEVKFNGKRAIGGISMGANASVMIANLNPGLYQGVFGISGCYSTLDDTGRQISNLTVATRGGNLDNVWGPYGSAGWKLHDVPSNPSGLANTPLFLSAGSGVLSEEEREMFYAGPDVSEIITSNILETGVRTCTQRLEDSLRKHHQLAGTKVVYTDHGAHTWINFNSQLGAAWEHIRPGLY